MKKIESLVKDIYKTIEGRGGWTNTISESFGVSLAHTANNRFSEPQKPRGYLSLSSVGTPCQRKLWYKINKPKVGEPLKPNNLLKFFYGDMIEELILHLAVASGHEVKGMQDRLDVHGVKGHRDAVINGMTIDVKSCSSYAFKKFKEGRLREDDPFGYIAQISAYAQANNLKEAAFLAIDKSTGELTLAPVHSMEFINAEARIDHLKRMVISDTVPDLCYDPVPDGKSGNFKLPVGCVFCSHKRECWADANAGRGIRVFKYAQGKRYLVQVSKEPDVPEVMDW